MDYKKVGLQVLDAVGGGKNVVTVTHCATRLRFELQDSSVPDDEKVKAIPGVLNVVRKGGQYQVVIGPSVQEAFREVEKHVGPKENRVKSEDQPKESLFNRVMAKVIGIFTPMIPAITGAGMVKAVLALAKALGWIDPSGQTYYVLNFISDSAFYFMPMILAYSSARIFECNPVLAMTLAGVLLHPNFQALVSTQDPVAFMGMPIRLTSYANTVFPIIIVVYVMSWVEKLTERYSPVFLKYILKPALTILITAPLALVILGPIGSFVGDGLSVVFNLLEGKAGWLVPTLMGTFTPLLVMFGVHTSLTPLATAQIATRGFETIFGPGMLASNIAQGASALAVTIKTKNKEFRQITLSAALTALIGGITEPAMYGVTMRLKKTLIPVMVGGGVAGLYAGLSGLVRFSFGSPGLCTLPCFIGGDDMSNFYKALITLAISFAITFVLTLIVKWEDPASESTSENKDMLSPDTADTEVVLISPLEGQTVPLEEVKDETFSSKTLGDGIGILPKTGKVVAPLDGTVSYFDTKHAVMFQSDNGIEMLIHVGIDTVEMNGEGFRAVCENNTHVKAGDLLLEFDIEKIRKSGYDTTTVVLITGAENRSISWYGSGEMKMKDPILRLI